MSQFSKWNTYISERSPMAALTFLSAGIATSSMAYYGEFSTFWFFAGIILSNIIFFQMRLGDELKDFETDKIINPTRPLPRGLLSTQEVFKTLIWVVILMIAVSLIISFIKSPLGGAALVSTTVFAWLMFKEFYIGQSLAKSPIIYAISHQIIVFPLFGWIALTLDPDLINHKEFLGWLLANFGASFTFEICRKLDPKAHKLAGTYAHHYGRPVTVLFCAIFMSLSAWGACLADFWMASWPALIILLISQIVWIKNPEKYKIPAGLSALSSAIILWSPAVIWLIKRWS